MLVHIARVTYTLLIGFIDFLNICPTCTFYLHMHPSNLPNLMSFGNLGHTNYDHKPRPQINVLKK